MKAVPTEGRLSDPAWIFKRKLDGIRCVTGQDGDAVRLLSRNGLRLDARVPELGAALQRDPAVIGGHTAPRGAREELVGTFDGAGLRYAGKVRTAFDRAGPRDLGARLRSLRGAGFAAVRAFARANDERLAAQDPERLTTEQRKERRGERIFLDAGRNAYAQHTVAPYAVRARPSAAVGTPLHRTELDDRTLRPDGWTITTIGARLDAGGDPWRELGRRRRGLPALAAPA